MNRRGILKGILAAPVLADQAQAQAQRSFVEGAYPTPPTDYTSRITEEGWKLREAYEATQKLEAHDPTPGITPEHYAKRLIPLHLACLRSVKLSAKLCWVADRARREREEQQTTVELAKNALAAYCDRIGIPCPFPRLEKKRRFW